MTSTVFVKFSYEDRVSEEVPIQVELDLTNNTNREKLMNRLLKSNPNITEVTLLSWIMKLQITEIEFDLTDDCDEYIDTELLQDQLQSVYIGQFWNVDDDLELVDLISDKSGWCVNSINYKEIKWTLHLEHWDITMCQ